MIHLEDFYGPNAGYVLELYERYQLDPESVDPETRAFFEQWQPPSESEAGHPRSPKAATEYTVEETEKIVHVARLARMIREVGHLAANLDPLGSNPPGDPGLQLSTHQLHIKDLLSLPPNIVGGPLAEGSKNALEAIGKLRLAYCGSLGYEDDHIQIADERKWLRGNVESGAFFKGFDDEYKRRLLERLTEVEVFERYLHQTFVGQKRFSIEGTDMLIPMLDWIIVSAAKAEVHEVLIGMAHRGRLNVLAHVLGKPYSVILSEFMHTTAPGTRNSGADSGGGNLGWTGDVKYHKGAGYLYKGPHEMPISLASNPSHLEFVDPVIIGRTRAAQERREKPGIPTQDSKLSGAILIHGDAAFPGQGIVAETLNLSQLPGYDVGGTIHIITNNQIGFTTTPREGRSTLYASDLAKGFEIPIVHVNADDPLACIAATRMAFGYCSTFHKDFLIDLVGYRRWGHNEGDEPSFTQPRMYQAIATHPTVRELWAREMVRERVVIPEEVEAMVKGVRDKLEQARGKAKTLVTDEAHNTTVPPPGDARPVETAVPAKALIEINTALNTLPEHFTPNPKLERTLQKRRDALGKDGEIEWAHAEALAFATILADGTPIRMTGQDVERGTFSQRHLVLHDPTTGKPYTALHHIPQAKASFAIYNSPLSENAVLGFEYGYSRHARGTLVLWEAQFGDFANSAQVIIDQFVVAGHAKWRQTPTLVMLLPHGYEGQGAEHSSARLERFLQLCANDNLRVVNCTTSGQYFHVLRRQAMLLELAPRPLVVMSPKSLLRNPRAASTLADLSEGRFQPVLDDPRYSTEAKGVTRLVLCSGKVYVDLISHPDYAGADHVAALRVEELYPFPSLELKQAASRYPNVGEVIWLQEEPHNMGAWSFVEPRLQNLFGPEMPLRYVGRPESASPAEGSQDQHLAMQNYLLSTALAAVPARKERQRSELSHAR
jgi:2-oxoglutarate dehydrogenase E1 component